MKKGRKDRSTSSNWSQSNSRAVSTSTHSSATTPPNKRRQSRFKSRREEQEQQRQQPETAGGIPLTYLVENKRGKGERGSRSANSIAGKASGAAAATATTETNENNQRGTRSNSKKETAKTKPKASFLDGKDPDTVLFVYPFAGNPQEIEAAAVGLNEASGGSMLLLDEEQAQGQQQQASTKGEDDNKKLPGGENSSSTGTAPAAAAVAVAAPSRRAHYVTIRLDDYDRLDPGEWLNDSLVDLWMQWYGSSSFFWIFLCSFFVALVYLAISHDNFLFLALFLVPLPGSREATQAYHQIFISLRHIFTLPCRLMGPVRYGRGRPGRRLTFSKSVLYSSPSTRTCIGPSASSSIPARSPAIRNKDTTTRCLVSFFWIP